jgi:hypothetical protein
LSLISHSNDWPKLTYPIRSTSNDSFQSVSRRKCPKIGFKFERYSNPTTQQNNPQPVYYAPQQSNPYYPPQQSNWLQQTFSPYQQPLLQQPIQQPVYQQPIVQQQPVLQQQPILQQPIVQPVLQQPIIQQQPVLQQPIVYNQQRYVSPPYGNPQQTVPIVVNTQPQKKKSFWEKFWFGDDEI